MIKKNILIISFLILSISCFSETVKIYGNAPSYSGDQLTFFFISNYITNSEIHASSCVVSDTGNFSCKINTNNTKLIFVYLGIYKCYLYIEPGKDYEVILPEKEEKNVQEKY